MLKQKSVCLDPDKAIILLLLEGEDVNTELGEIASVRAPQICVWCFFCCLGTRENPCSHLQQQLLAPGLSTTSLQHH